jgi:diguanylate cyclase (GGDEF)-like protein
LKLVNDALGHAKGNELIVAISNILRDCVMEQGIIARTGGDDFSIILPETSNEEAKKLMKRIEVACNEYISKSKNSIYHASISLGCATKVNKLDSLGSIIKNAEDTMFRNKLLQNKSMHSSVISSMKTTLLAKSQETEEHALRLIQLSRAVGQKMKLTDEQLNELELLSTLHDIGKIGVSDSIINKPGKLSEEERVLMKKHPEIGYRIAMTSQELLPIAEYILCHHERYDGKGYPQGLKGNDIPLLSRIIAVVDAYDAMTEDRPYRKAMTKEAAIAEIRRNAGTQFDPEIAKILTDIIELT